MEYITEFTPAYDKRDPDPLKDYGTHSVTLRMILKGEHGAVQFVLYTGWQLPHVAAEHKAKDWDIDPLPADLGYHSPKPIYEDQRPIEESCKWLDGKPCYYDGSGLNAERIFEILLREGSEGVWRGLEGYYISIFGSETICSV